jgi:plastocyanin
MTASKPNNAGAKELKPPAAEQTTGSAPQPSQSGGSASGGGASGGGSASAKPTRTVKLAADASRLAYDTKSLTAKAGTVTIDFDNPAPIRHDVHIESSSGKQLGGTKRIANGKASARLKLPPGTYTFYCSVPGHRQAGMQGTLTVK